MSIIGLMSDQGLGFIQSPTLKVAPKIPDYTPLMKAREYKESLKAKLAEDNAKTDPKITNAVAQLSQNMKGLTKSTRTELTNAITELQSGWDTLVKNSGGNQSLAIQKPEYQQLMTKAASYGDVYNELAREKEKFDEFKTKVDQSSAHEQINMLDFMNPGDSRVNIGDSGIDKIDSNSELLKRFDTEETFRENPNKEAKMGDVVNEGLVNSLVVSLAGAAASNSDKSEDFKTSEDIWAKMVGGALPPGLKTTLFQTSYAGQDNKTQLDALVTNIQSYFTDPMMKALQSKWLKEEGYVIKDKDLGWVIPSDLRNDIVDTDTQTLKPEAQKMFNNYLERLVGKQVEPMRFRSIGTGVAGQFQVDDGGGGSKKEETYNLPNKIDLGISETKSETMQVLDGPNLVNVPVKVAVSPLNLPAHNNISLYNEATTLGILGGSPYIFNSKQIEDTRVISLGGRVTYVPKIVYSDQGGAHFDESFKNPNAPKDYVPTRVARVATTVENFKDILKTMRVQDTVWEMEQKKELISTAGKYMTEHKDATWGELHEFLVGTSPDVMKKLSSNNISLDVYSAQNKDKKVVYNSQPKSFNDQNFMLEREKEKLSKTDFNDLINSIHLTGTLDEATIDNLFSGSNFMGGSGSYALNIKDPVLQPLINKLKLKIADSWSEIAPYAQTPSGNASMEIQSRFNDFTNETDGWITNKTSSWFENVDRIILFEYDMDISQQLKDLGSSDSGTLDTPEKITILNESNSK